MLRHLRRGSAIGSILTTDSTDRHGSLGSGTGVQLPTSNLQKPLITRIARIQFPKSSKFNSPKPRITRIQFLTDSCQLPTLQVPSHRATDHTDHTGHTDPIP